MGQKETEDLTVESTADLRVRIDQTRLRLDQHLAALESAVHEKISTVRELAEHSIEQVKQAVDVRYQTRRHPWPAMAAAIGVGLLASRLLGPRLFLGAAFGRRVMRGGESAALKAAPLSHAMPSIEDPPDSVRQNFLSRVGSQLATEASQFKGVALTLIVEGLRRAINQALERSNHSSAEVVRDGWDADDLTPAISETGYVRH